MLAVVEIKARFDEQNNISLGAQARARGRPRRLRHRRAEDARQAVPRRPAGGRGAAPLLPRRHRQLQPQDRPALRGPRPAHRRRPGRRGPHPPVQPALRASRRAAGSSGCSSRPRSVRSGLIDLIDAEIEHEQRQPGSGHIAWKVNSIVDEQLIDALYRASQAGVQVAAVGARHLRAAPGRAGAVREHRGPLDPRPLPRALAHLPVRRAAATPSALIGSADMMHRNLDRRVEALVRLDRPAPPRRPRVADGARHERRVLALEARRRRPVDAPPPRRRRRPAHRPAGRPHRDARHGAAARPAGGDSTDRGRRRRGSQRPAPSRGASSTAPSRWPSCTARATTTGPGPRASSTPARTGPVAAVRETEEETGLRRAPRAAAAGGALHAARPGRHARRQGRALLVGPGHRWRRAPPQRDRRGRLARRRQRARPPRLRPRPRPAARPRPPAADRAARHLAARAGAARPRRGPWLLARAGRHHPAPRPRRS